jgi:Arc/MetJ-type ribon-helix-helix transcriptional regulator
MTYPFPPDVVALVQQQMATGRFASEDELLREALQALLDADDDYTAIQEALDELEQGDEGLPIDEAFEQIKSGQLRRTAP